MQSKGMYRSLNTAGTVINQTALGRRDSWAGTINVGIAIEMVQGWSRLD